MFLPKKLNSYNNGYSREDLGTVNIQGVDYILETTWKNINGTQTFMGYRLKDKHGFLVVESDLDARSNGYIPLEHAKDSLQPWFNFSMEECKTMLTEGEEMWCWNNMSLLSGSAGLAIVKDGKVLRRLTIAIA